MASKHAHTETECTIALIGRSQLHKCIRVPVSDDEGLSMGNQSDRSLNRGALANNPNANQEG